MDVTDLLPQGVDIPSSEGTMQRPNPPQDITGNGRTDGTLSGVRVGVHDDILFTPPFSADITLHDQTLYTSGGDNLPTPCTFPHLHTTTPHTGAGVGTSVRTSDMVSTKKIAPHIGPDVDASVRTSEMTLNIIAPHTDPNIDESVRTSEMSFSLHTSTEHPQTQAIVVFRKPTVLKKDRVDDDFVHQTPITTASHTSPDVDASVRMSEMPSFSHTSVASPHAKAIVVHKERVDVPRHDIDSLSLSLYYEFTADDTRRKDVGFIEHVGGQWFKNLALKGNWMEDTTQMFNIYKEKYQSDIDVVVPRTFFPFNNID
ncbi:hypothetical protein JRO89_XS06G0201300 [Xanthoceras sorbifolium]|uniref:Uncharacterized protein n=1 Tax=Xanthoceras sorbifolium TaxID=99658 RepID=A0ABQ8HYZ4_9ROSI|nr:hypothetical protein JRO89_XS06G0201300 [Xanthoceras sorbifolium]